ncbi:uncharacterized protein TRIVIDRAFT_163280 [Trichoderma virens Gv29-8]|uniref:Uncharacterized protein n=1 Tax=Hypocrea virens (strain Gv29-8 / FGSC 10586) TaxID=413071 RepID=G9NBH0_HYPVG|nr:uncharacterized protein TRIVIDRAFT_163280 [Trichoderma virens Gv29-8]EHK16175.1 hypothetical protein TRIVIDRAFT_163280 [Trichoderma virens Gv29-8]
MGSQENFTIGWVCALPEEYNAACAILDEDLEGPETEQGDRNTYFFGRVANHRIVITCLPSGRYGLSSATRAAKDMMRSFPHLRFLLLVGTAGGAPTAERDIRLGDVVYDHGKLVGGELQRTGHMNSPPLVLLGALMEMRRRHHNPAKFRGVDEHLKLLSKYPNFQRPEEDRLFRSDAKHRGGTDCLSCDMDALVMRPPRTSGRAFNVFYGTIASANTVMKDAAQRDVYANDPNTNALCFEMEAAGLMNDFPCIVIRGISNYSDSHKNDEWRQYAASTAAAYAKELLCLVKPVRGS